MDFTVNETVTTRISGVNGETCPLLRPKRKAYLELLCDPLQLRIVEGLIGNHSEAIATLPSRPALGAFLAVSGYAFDDRLVDRLRSSRLV